MNKQLTIKNMLASALVASSVCLAAGAFAPAAQAAVPAEQYNASAAPGTQIAYWYGPRHHYCGGNCYRRNVYWGGWGVSCNRSCWINRWGNMNCARRCW